MAPPVRPPVGFLCSFPGMRGSSAVLANLHVAQPHSMPKFSRTWLELGLGLGFGLGVGLGLTLSIHPCQPRDKLLLQRRRVLWATAVACAQAPPVLARSGLLLPHRALLLPWGAVLLPRRRGAVLLPRRRGALLLPRRRGLRRRSAVHWRCAVPVEWRRREREGGEGGEGKGLSA